MSQPHDDKSSLVGEKIGNYEIVSLLGKGGMGEVYVAHHPVLDRKVAVKVLSRALSDDENLVARFRQEAQAAGRIGHDAIVEVTDFGTLPDERCYYVMELLNGLSLQEYLDERGVVTVSEALAILRPVLDGLAAAHAAGIVHRDIKPDNIFLHRDPQGKLRPKLLDFGIAKLMDPNVGDGSVETRTGQLLGTPLYMSPEQAAGETQSIGPWSDIYSVAAVLFRMLTGKPPYQAKSFGALLLKHMQDPPPDLTSERPDLSSALDGLIRGAMAKTPGERCQTVRSFLQQLLSEAPEQGQVSHTLPGPIPRDRAQIATEPTMRAESSHELPTEAISSTTPANLSAPGPEGEPPGPRSVVAESDDPPQDEAQPSPQSKRAWGRRILMGAGALTALLLAGWAIASWLPRSRVQAPAAPDQSPPAAPQPGPSSPPQPPTRHPPAATNPWVLVSRPAHPLRLGLGKVAADEPYFRLIAGWTCCTRSFQIQQHEVTWGEYRPWAAARAAARAQAASPEGAASAVGRHAPMQAPPDAAHQSNLPAVGVGWKSAMAYCAALGARLPREVELEYAARGPELALNPWGSGALDPARTALLVGSRPTLRPVCSSDQDVIRHGGKRLCDLAANAMEWTLDPYTHPVTPKTPPAQFPFAGLRARHWRAVRGLPILMETDPVPRAASLYRAPGCISIRVCMDPERRRQHAYTGFRCVRGPRS